jgi:hypothetical protein
LLCLLQIKIDPSVLTWSYNLAKTWTQQTLVPIQGALVRSNKRVRGRPIPIGDHQGNSSLWRGREKHHMKAVMKRTKGPSEPPHSHCNRWPPIVGFICSDPGRRGVKAET